MIFTSHTIGNPPAFRLFYKLQTLVTGYQQEKNRLYPGLDMPLKSCLKFCL